MEIRNNALIVTPVTYTTSSGNNNNVDLKGTLIVVTTSNNNDTITGIIPFNDGHWIEIINNSTNVLIITHNDSNSSATNRFTTDTGQSIKLAQKDRVGGFYQNGSFYVYKLGSKGRLIGRMSILNDTDFVFGAINTATAITFNQNVSIIGSLSHSTSSNPSRITALEKGVMQVIINNQVLKGAAGSEQIFFWFRLNGVDVTNSAYAMQLSNGENDVFVINATFDVVINDYVEGYASVTNTGIKLDASAASAPVPLIPSTIAEVLLFSAIN